MEKGIFITGTDTGVGKTFVSALLLSSLRKAGINAVPMKPIQTGCLTKKGRLTAPDLDFILNFADMKPTNRDRKLMCPYRFKPACSPHLAAVLARKPISLTIIARAFKKLTAKHQMAVVEGAGGILAPINGEKTMLSLMKILQLPVILVTRPGLGTINHTLLSIREIRRAGLKLKGIVFNQTHPGRPGLIEKDNLRTVARLGKVKVLGCIPFINLPG